MAGGAHGAANHCLVLIVRATASNATGSCVELGAFDGGIAMRNSRDPNGPALLYTRDEIAAFIHGVKSGEFDDLIAQP